MRSALEGTRSAHHPDIGVQEAILSVSFLASTITLVLDLKEMNSCMKERANKTTRAFCALSVSKATLVILNSNAPNVLISSSILS